MDTSIPPKRCPGCQQFLPTTKEFFYSDKSRHDKLTRLCKQCDNAASRKRKKRVSKSKPDLPPGLKQCTGTCQRILPATSEFFHRHKKLGLRPRCKKCTSEANKVDNDAHREQINARQRQSYAENPEKDNARGRAYRQENKEVVNARRRANY